MGIPGIEDFDAFASIATASDDELCHQAGYIVPSREALRAFLEASWRSDAAHQAAIRATAVWRWFESQPTFTRAMRAAFANEGRPDPMQPIDSETFIGRESRRIGKVLSTPSGVDEAKTRTRLAKRLQSRITSRRPYRLYASFANAFSRYLYATGEHDARTSLEEAAASIASIRTSLAQSVGRRCVVDPFDAAAPGLFLNADCALGRLESALRKAGVGAMPSTRRDQTLPERQLVWDLRAALREFFSKDKPTAIFYLMSMEGIERPPDMRTIERLLQSWRGTERRTDRPARNRSSD